MDSKVVDETWFIRIGRLWGLQVGGQEKLSPENLLGCSFIIKGKVGMPGRTSLSFLSRHVLSSAPPVAQTVKHLPTMWETQVQPLGWEDPLEKKMATHSSTLAWKIPWTEEPGSTVHGVTKSRTRLSDFTTSLPRPSWAGKFSCPYIVTLGSQIIVSYV